MSKPRYIIIPNWDRFQHYKDRRPAWIKNYTELLDKDEYWNLSGHQRGVLHGTWMAFARSDCQLPGDTLTLSRRLGVKVTTADIDALIQAGFLRLSASKVIAKRKQVASPTRARARGRKEVEREKETETSVVSPTRNGPHDATEQHGSEEIRTQIEASLRSVS
jgi:hypothetical protein